MCLRRFRPAIADWDRLTEQHLVRPPPRARPTAYIIQSQIHVIGSMYLNPGFRLDGGSASGQNASLRRWPA